MTTDDGGKNDTGPRQSIRFWAGLVLLALLLALYALVASSLRNPFR